MIGDAAGNPRDQPMSRTEEFDHHDDRETTTRHFSGLTPDAISGRAWHAVESTHVLDAFRSRDGGLSADEASHRYRTFGPNRLPEMARRVPRCLFSSSSTTH
jgi:hypothetical protein